jgi:Spy/CpxP family protein refolding chaperone
MKMRNANQLAVLFGLTMGVFLLSTANVLANEEHGFNKEDHRKEWQAKKDQMYEKLGLTEEQKQALKAHKEGYRDETKSLKEQIKEKRKAYRQALESPDVDENAIIAANNEIKVLENKLDDIRLSGVLELRKILTPEQIQTFNELEKKRKEKHHDGPKGSQMQ